MKYPMKLCLLLIVLLLITCSCAQNMGDVATPAVRPENADEINPSLAPNGPLTTLESNSDSNAETSTWEQDFVYTAWVNSEQSNVLCNIDSLPEPASVAEMLPLIELVLAYRTGYDFYHEDLKHVPPFDGNEHSIDNELYTWGLMFNLFCTYGEEHPEAVAYPQPNHPNMLLIPEQVAKDFFKACFSQYDESQAMLIEPPDGWSGAAVGYTGLEPDGAMTFNGSAYVCDRDNFMPPTGIGQKYVITSSVEAGGGIYRLNILTIYGPDELDISGYEVDLIKNDSPDVFGFQWRIYRIIRTL